MEFLKCIPSVFVIGDEFEILINTKEKGLCFINIGGRKYYEKNSGVLSSDKTYFKIRIPQQVLNDAARYEVVFRATIERRAYFSEFAPMQKEEFVFNPLLKQTDIHIYHLADIHYRFSTALKTASYFGENGLDLLLVNGDIGEVETEENYQEVCNFLGELSQGKIPVVLSRGNHDTRGKLAERFTDFFPNNDKKTYYAFEIGPLAGVVLDCGEDKPDNNKEYGGTNVFEAFRREETEYLKSVDLSGNKLRFAVSHICPVCTTHTKGDVFDIERDTYAEWNRELERMGIRFMICGHIHTAYILRSDDEKNTLPHNYPVIVGSALYDEDVWGTALIVEKDRMNVYFTDSLHRIRDRYTITF